MADRDFDPKDGGYIRVMNQFVDKLISCRLDANEWGILMLVMRKTWGVQGRPWAKLKWKYIREAKVSDLFDYMERHRIDPEAAA